MHTDISLIVPTARYKEDSTSEVETTIFALIRPALLTSADLAAVAAAEMTTSVVAVDTPVAPMQVTITIPTLDIQVAHLLFLLHVAPRSSSKVLTPARGM